MLSIFAEKKMAKRCVIRKAKFYLILLEFGQVKFCPGKLTRVFQFCLGNPNSTPGLPRLPTLMSNPAFNINYTVYFQFLLFPFSIPLLYWLDVSKVQFCSGISGITFKKQFLVALRKQQQHQQQRQR